MSPTHGYRSANHDHAQDFHRTHDTPDTDMETHRRPRAQRAVALAMFEYGDLPAALDADTR